MIVDMKTFGLNKGRIISQAVSSFEIYDIRAESLKQLNFSLLPSLYTPTQNYSVQNHSQDDKQVYIYIYIVDKSIRFIYSFWPEILPFEKLHFVFKNF